ncbi:transketolase [Sporomusaceae bacterium BoRhaA]|uniref:transketolase n=1 Tax=Pelorhabdus rhamnosifermentans TaxID=2772457 RepID=UPI001C062B1D|nr:transketolase [Pelorhabdus rhamnosifermentans]MBU2699911.1 transketolase [Pelorhabdus rhamnosifermentans]
MNVNEIDQLAVNTIRILSIDAIEKANSGHPGMPMGAASMAYQLWTKHLNQNPENPKWFNRDRFVLSGGHGSMLLYSLLHLAGYDLSLDDLKQFRQWQSKTPGHPEYGHTQGVEATTGPLGQGIAMAVGMAMAERHLAAQFNKGDIEIIHHYTYGMCGDGDLMEGVSAEAASYAGHLKLGKLIVLYDSNNISLDGNLDQSFSENVQQRFEAYGWQVLRVEDGNDLVAIDAALNLAKADIHRPTLIEVKTTIGYGSPNKSGSSVSHGSPLGKEEAKLTKQFYQWSHEEFYVPDEVYTQFKHNVKERGQKAENDWNALFKRYIQQYPELGEALTQAISGNLPENWENNLPIYETGKKVATRSASGEVINAIAGVVPTLFGGSADLSSSTKTMMKTGGNFMADDYSGRNIWFGVREFAMGAELNGMALHGGVKVFGGTFFVFCDYLRPAIRLAALMKLPVTYVFTHDSIAVGEDGPTHEPVEQLASLRPLPNINLIRPADGNETAAAWKVAMESKDKPTALILSRQNLPTLESTPDLALEGVARGAYVVSKTSATEPKVLLLASGSEVAIAIEAQQQLEAEHIATTVVSFPSWNLFEEQSAEYKKSILLPQVKARLAIEMGASLGWERYIGDEGDVLAIDRFGASGRGEKVMQEYGFTVENIIAKAKALVK